jgi:hypothetical protein
MKQNAAKRIFQFLRLPNGSNPSGQSKSRRDGPQTAIPDLACPHAAGTHGERDVRPMHSIRTNLRLAKAVSDVYGQCPTTRLHCLREAADRWPDLLPTSAEF